MKSLLVIAAILFTSGCDEINPGSEHVDVSITDTSSKVEYIYMPELVINAEHQEIDKDVIIFTEEETQQVFKEAFLTVSLKD